MTTLRSIFIGDVHGCLSEFESLLEAVAPREGDKLCFTGDLVDRGPDSLGVVRRVRDLLVQSPGSACVAGKPRAKGPPPARERHPRRRVGAPGDRR